MHNNNDNNNHQRTEASNQMPAASQETPAGVQTRAGSSLILSKHSTVGGTACHQVSVRLRQGAALHLQLVL